MKHHKSSCFCDILRILEMESSVDLLFSWKWAHDLLWAGQRTQPSPEKRVCIRITLHKCFLSYLWQGVRFCSPSNLIKNDSKVFLGYFFSPNFVQLSKPSIWIFVIFYPLCVRSTHWWLYHTLSSQSIGPLWHHVPVCAVWPFLNPTTRLAGAVGVQNNVGGKFIGFPLFAS